MHYNAVYDRIYRNPIQLQLTQYIYGVERKGLGEAQMQVNGFDPTNRPKVHLYEEAEDGTINYLLGYPVYNSNRKYQFGAFAYEDYYYNNTPSGRLDRVAQRGGNITIHNGLHSTKSRASYSLDERGKNNAIWLDVDNLDTENSGTGALRTLSAVLNVEGAAVETTTYQAFVTGDRVNEKELTSTEADIHILDIVRDPGGNGSSAWVESGTTYSFSYQEKLDAKAGLELTPSYGGSVSRDIGIFAGTGAGNYIDRLSLQVSLSVSPCRLWYLIRGDINTPIR